MECCHELIETQKNKLPWVEKYRPKTLEDICSQDDAKASLNKCIKIKCIPHLLFYGPSGCGKTSTILAFAKQIFPKKLWEERIIEFNASDERGINVVRNKIKQFAKNSVNNTNSLIPPWKIIILDEADSMTSDSQFALRRIMEIYSNVTRFCIICNYENKIIDPISSRCAHFRFKPISKKNTYLRLKLIAKEEKVKYNKPLLDKIITLTRGDLRQSINMLQRYHCTFNSKLDADILDEFSGIMPSNKINELYRITTEESLADVINYIEYLQYEGYSLVNQIRTIYNLIKTSDLDGSTKSKIFLKISEVDHHLVKGCDEFVQFLRLFSYINLIFNQ